MPPKVIVAALPLTGADIIKGKADYPGMEMDDNGQLTRPLNEHCLEVITKASKSTSKKRVQMAMKKTASAILAMHRALTPAVANPDAAGVNQVAPITAPVVIATNNATDVPPADTTDPRVAIAAPTTVAAIATTTVATAVPTTVPVIAATASDRNAERPGNSAALMSNADVFEQTPVVVEREGVLIFGIKFSTGAPEVIEFANDADLKTKYSAMRAAYPAAMRAEFRPMTIYRTSDHQYYFAWFEEKTKNFSVETVQDRASRNDSNKEDGNEDERVPAGLSDGRILAKGTDAYNEHERKKRFLTAAIVALFKPNGPNGSVSPPHNVILMKTGIEMMNLLQTVVNGGTLGISHLVNEMWDMNHGFHVGYALLMSGPILRCAELLQASTELKNGAVFKTLMENIERGEPVHLTTSCYPTLKRVVEIMYTLTFAVDRLESKYGAPNTVLDTTVFEPTMWNKIWNDMQINFNFEFSLSVSCIKPFLQGKEVYDITGQALLDIAKLAGNTTVAPQIKDIEMKDAIDRGNELILSKGIYSVASTHPKTDGVNFKLNSGAIIVHVAPVVAAAPAAAVAPVVHVAAAEVFYEYEEEAAAPTNFYQGRHHQQHQGHQQYQGHQQFQGRGFGGGGRGGRGNRGGFGGGGRGNRGGRGGNNTPQQQNVQQALPATRGRGNRGGNGGRGAGRGGNNNNNNKRGRGRGFGSGGGRL